MALLSRTIAPSNRAAARLLRLARNRQPQPQCQVGRRLRLAAYFRHATSAVRFAVPHIPARNCGAIFHMILQRKHLGPAHLAIEIQRKSLLYSAHFMVSPQPLCRHSISGSRSATALTSSSRFGNCSPNSGPTSRTYAVSLFRKRIPPARDSRLHRAQRNLQNLRDLVVRHVFQIAQDDRGPVRFRHSRQRLLPPPPALHRAQIARTEIRPDRPAVLLRAYSVSPASTGSNRRLLRLVPEPPAPAVRRLVQRDPIDPRLQAGLAMEMFHPAKDFEKYFLCGIRRIRGIVHQCGRSGHRWADGIRR